MNVILMQLLEHYNLFDMKKKITDKERMDWLCSKFVEVRQPLLYGSREIFLSQMCSEEWEEDKSTLREQIDSEIKNGQ